MAKPPKNNAFHRGAVRPQPKKGHSQAHGGVSPLHPVSHRNTSFQPLPRPLGLPPYRYDITDAFPDIAKQIQDLGKMTFHIVGDSGGVKDAEFQLNVADQMIDHLDHPEGEKPLFCYHVGDVVYFTGAHDDYYSQFYEPYSHYDAPIFSIPGNHDGEVDDPSEGPSLGGWVSYFMQQHPDVDPISKDSPRVQLDLPNVYWTLITPLATIIGLYTNVPEGGSIDSVQQQWLTNEFATAPENLPLILALHHPVYSFDTHHSGSSKMADALENAIRDTGRVPNLVLSGHVHNYQRIEQKIANNSPTPFIVCGNGGYHNLHKIAAETDKKPDKADHKHKHNKSETTFKPAKDTGAQLIFGCDNAWGFVTLTIDKETISGVSLQVDRNTAVTAGDKFEYPAKPVTIAKGSVPTL
jgi:acid phosphatase type 7